MVLRFFLLAGVFFFASCHTVERDNPLDPDGVNYRGGSSPGSSTTTAPSSSSVAVVSECSLNGGTVKIGEQTWMKENLNCNVEGSVCNGEGWQIYDPETDSYSPDPEVQANCNKYGRLYDWATAMVLSLNCNNNFCASIVGAKHRGICPSGWHIPSKDEWDALSTYIESDKGCIGCAAKHLKAISGWDDNVYGWDENGLDSYGFSALPGGSSSGYGSSQGPGSVGYWWSASEGHNSNSVFGLYMRYSSDYADWDDFGKSNLYSVRCLKD